MDIRLAMAYKCFVTSDRFVRATIVLALVSVVSVLPVQASETGLSPNPSIALPLEPKSAADWLKRGVENAKKNDLDGAIADFNQAIQLKRDYAAAYFNRGTTYANIGRRQDAIADYTQVILLKPNNAYVRYNRGLLLADAGNKQEAIADFQQAATLFKQQLNNKWQERALNKLKQLQQP
jgi:tetratricopeptide (TPR) repeat protein